MPRQLQLEYGEIIHAAGFSSFDCVLGFGGAGRVTEDKRLSVCRVWKVSLAVLLSDSQIRSKVSSSLDEHSVYKKLFDKHGNLVTKWSPTFPEKRLPYAVFITPLHIYRPHKDLEIAMVLKLADEFGADARIVVYEPTRDCSQADLKSIGFRKLNDLAVFALSVRKAQVAALMAERFPKTRITTKIQTKA